ncbi:hypothetical protein [Siphonobacter sp. SORGH_AS_0500]|uniref:hypothetical protein n=1 Tax=Siphonobacter sp. SORGH_AS_0500 TaxID=1864824 RepID=UPI002857CDFB|nr:hypothetical protein [Siphonobacter sp. SORGH_AS_0500]MDR6196181.1 hypothetical protein [Siphonobacter sp. SORGH_AS_0500]
MNEILKDLLKRHLEGAELVAPELESQQKLNRLEFALRDVNAWVSSIALIKPNETHVSSHIKLLTVFETLAVSILDELNQLK